MICDNTYCSILFIKNLISCLYFLYHIITVNNNSIDSNNNNMFFRYWTINTFLKYVFILDIIILVK